MTITYTIQTKSNGSVIVPFNLEGPNSITHGETATFEFHLPTNVDTLTVDFDELVVSNSYTIPSGETETHPLVTVESGATLTVDGTLKTSDIVINGTLDGSGTVDVIDGLNEYVVNANTTEVYDQLTVKDRNELRIEGTLAVANADIDGEVDNNGVFKIQGNTTTLFKDYEEHAGKFTVNETLNSNQRYTERLDTNDPIDSLVIAIEPVDELQNKEIVGVWGIIENVDDTRPTSLSTSRVQIDVTVLDEFSAYTDHADIEASLKI